MEKIIYGYDAIIINFKDYDRDEMNDILPIMELQNECYSIRLEINNSGYYRTRLKLSAPTETGLNILASIQEQLGNYRFRKIEICKDIITGDEVGSG